ncbi:MAG: CinA family nicotinamide mononucleotide deamidase-related protein [Planctomycetota bacterium]|jgi:nicotinamide-nucleotide amidase
MSGLRAEIIAIGDELTHGRIQDSNSAYIARELEPLGLEVRRITVASDDPELLDRVFAEVCARADLVIASGGIGPTEDDRSRHAAAAAAGVELEFREDCWQQIAAWFEKRGKQATESNRRQALLPVGAVALDNLWGTAPGFRLAVGQCTLFMFPGVPREMRRMLSRHLVPWISEQSTGLRPMAFHHMLVVGPGEAELNDRIARFMHHDCEPRVGVTARSGLLTICIAARAGSQDAAQKLCEESAAELRPVLGEDLVAEGGDDLTVLVGQELRRQGMSIAIAESCTGGMLSSALIALPGISEVYRAGFVCYSNAAKERDLGIPAELIEAEGAVSEAVAGAMAARCASRAEARIGLGISGVAGPGGGTAERPVGTVCFGLSLDGTSESWERRFPDLGREYLRSRSVLEALVALHRKLAERAAGS